MLIVRDNIPTTGREDLQTGCELLCVELTLAPSNLLVGAYYNPPGSYFGSLSHLRSYLATTHRYSPVLLVGDFYLYNIDWGSGSPIIPTVHSGDVTMCDNVHDFDLQQLILMPTRLKNILDLVWTNQVDCVHYVQVSAGLCGSDHDAIHFSTSLSIRKITTKNTGPTTSRKQTLRASTAAK